MRISDWSSDVCSSDLVAWKREIGEVKFGRPQLGRRHPDQDREQMARLRKLLTELWNFAAIGLILALRVEHFDQRAFARLAAFLGEIDVAQVFLEECVGGVDQVADRGDRQHLIEDRKSGVWGKSVAGRVGTGGGGSL